MHQTGTGSLKQDKGTTRLTESLTAGTRYHPLGWRTQGRIWGSQNLEAGRRGTMHGALGFSFRFTSMAGKGRLVL